MTEDKGVFLRIDGALMTVTGIFSWISPIIPVAMCFLPALTFFWSAVRSIRYRGNVPYPGAANPDAPAEETKGA